MRKIISLLVISSYVFAMNIEVTADKFTADENKLTGKFIGNVKVKKEDGELLANEIKIWFNAKKQPIKYEAKGEPNFKIKINKKTYFGKGKTLVFEPNDSKYSILGEAFLHEIDTDKKVYGENIIINQKKGSYEVDGEAKKPVKFIFKLDDKK